LIFACFARKFLPRSDWLDVYQICGVIRVGKIKKKAKKKKGKKTRKEKEKKKNKCCMILHSPILYIPLQKKANKLKNRKSKNQKEYQTT
jgi:hypothetical protein